MTPKRWSGQRRIPKGFRLKAQGCEERATLGNGRVGTSTPKELCRFKRAGLGRGEQRRNPVGVDGVLRMRTRGSSCLATLGWRTQSLWDWRCLYDAVPSAAFV